MQAYMKSAMPFLGVPAPERRRCVRRALDAAPLDPGAWRVAVLELWRDATHREERYAALDLAHRFRHTADPSDLPLYEELVVSGAWWDYVDPVAGLVGELLRRDPGGIRPVMLRWSRDADIWKRRVSIICQLSRKEETDLELLHSCIEANIDRPEFFLRKAIGWALRSLAWSDPAEVDRYVDALGDRLSALSRREATKHLARLMA